MDAFLSEVVAQILDQVPTWQHIKPCAWCRTEFVPEHPSQECCPEHQKFFSMPSPTTANTDEGKR